MNNLGDAKLRMAAMEIEAMTDAGYSADAKGFYLWWQESYPYFTHRTGPTPYSWDSEDIQVQRQTIIIRMVTGQWNEGYDGTPEDVIDTYIGIIRQWFANVEDLTSAAYPTPPTYLWSEAPEMTDDTGFRVFEGLTRNNAYQAGVEFTYTIPMLLTAS